MRIFHRRPKRVDAASMNLARDAETSRVMADVSERIGDPVQSANCSLQEGPAVARSIPIAAKYPRLGVAGSFQKQCRTSDCFIDPKVPTENMSYKVNMLSVHGGLTCRTDSYCVFVGSPLDSVVEIYQKDILGFEGLFLDVFASLDSLVWATMVLLYWVYLLLLLFI